MQNTLELLYREHDVIIRAGNILHSLRKQLAEDPPAYSENLLKLISFFKRYGDEYHHYKEEEILFPAMSKKNELVAEGIIAEMFSNHGDFRLDLAEVTDLLNRGQHELAQKKAEDYIEALFTHIAVENDELFQIAYSLFNDSELEIIQNRFMDFDRDKGFEEKKKLEKQLDEIRDAIGEYE